MVRQFVISLKISIQHLLTNPNTTRFLILITYNLIINQ